MSTFEIRRVNAKGKGVFVTRPVRNGDRIHTLFGRRITLVQSFAGIIAGLIRLDDPLQIDINKFFLLDYVSNCFNHSCDPNCAVVRESDLVATRDIQAGEELSYDYSLTVIPSFYSWAWRMKCACGASCCRVTIGNLSSVPRNKLEHALAAGLLQDYVVQYLRRLSNKTYD
ncbi:MAG: SET domain-containing protein-lysine N-methyltransferase [Hyphomicrobiaceae bacterium]